MKLIANNDLVGTGTVTPLRYYSDQDKVPAKTVSPGGSVEFDLSGPYKFQLTDNLIGKVSIGEYIPPTPPPGESSVVTFDFDPENVTIDEQGVASITANDGTVATREEHDAGSTLESDEYGSYVLGNGPNYSAGSALSCPLVTSLDSPIILYSVCNSGFISLEESNTLISYSGLIDFPTCFINLVYSYYIEYPDFSDARIQYANISSPSDSGENQSASSVYDLSRKAPIISVVYCYKENGNLNSRIINNLQEEELSTTDPIQNPDLSSTTFMLTGGMMEGTYNVASSAGIYECGYSLEATEEAFINLFNDLKNKYVG